MADFFRYILFRTEAWTVTGALVIVGIYIGQVLDASKPKDSAGTICGTLLVGAIGTGVIGGLCAALWQAMRRVTGHRVPAAPALFEAVAAARPGMVKGAAIGFAVCFAIAVAMTGLFVLTNEKTGVILGSRIVWMAGAGIAGASLGAAIASIGGLRITI
jgi:hypothetical protein